MIIEPTPIAGAYVFSLKPIADERGFFARSYCEKTIANAGIEPLVLNQQNVSFNKHKGTLRGLHFQLAPQEEIKLVRCTKGAVWDVIVDLRPQSKTYLKWHGITLKWNEYKTFYIPRGCAHGFLTLTDDAELFYQLSVPFVPELYRSLVWNEPRIGIEWPEKPLLISEKDAAAPGLEVIEKQLTT